MNQLTNLENRLEAIETRNQKVEIEKKWKNSWERKILVALTTYGTMWLFMTIIHVDKAWLNAIIPTLGFLLSTLSLSVFKKIWLQHQA